MSAALVVKVRRMRRGVGREDELRPELGRDLGELGEFQRLGVGPIEGVGQRLLQARDLGKLGMLGEAGVELEKLRNVAAEIPRALPVRRVGGDIGLGELGETGIAEIGMQLLVVVGQHLGEARDISVAVDAEQRFPLFLGAVLDLGKDRVVAGEDAALEALLKVFEAAHSAAAR